MNRKSFLEKLSTFWRNDVRELITIEVLSNYEDVSEGDLVRSKTSPSIRRVSLSRYLADKVQCIAERVEARDLVDIAAVIHKEPAMESVARQLLREQDILLITERLMGWTDDAIRDDLSAYDDVSSNCACVTRDLLLKWIRDISSEEDT